jgi:hypothetical protein
VLPSDEENRRQDAGATKTDALATKPAEYSLTSRTRILDPPESTV